MRVCLRVNLEPVLKRNRKKAKLHCRITEYRENSWNISVDSQLSLRTTISRTTLHVHVQTNTQRHRHDKCLSRRQRHNEWKLKQANGRYLQVKKSFGNFPKISRKFNTNFKSNQIYLRHKAEYQWIWHNNKTNVSTGHKGNFSQAISQRAHGDRWPDLFDGHKSFRTIMFSVLSCVVRSMSLDHCRASV